MAAPYSPTELRIGLRFDYPPPAIPESSDIWFLLDSENCRAVTDVSAIIRKRFYYGRRGALYLDGRLLHPRENVRIIRDNDTISVKWEESPRGQLTTDSQDYSIMASNNQETFPNMDEVEHVVHYKIFTIGNDISSLPDAQFMIESNYMLECLVEDDSMNIQRTVCVDP
ncbi:coilin-like [Ranitomeya variabilis]|uniref:coilin-like n=1 Tax=Ranitomeya variabilis TaxID=490064 RepID=UPI004056BF67